MKAVKFILPDVPSYVTQDLLIDDPVHGTIIGYRVFIHGIGDVRIVNGDLIVLNDKDEPIDVVTSSELSSSENRQQIAKDIVAEELRVAIWKAFKDANLTNNVKLSIANTIIITLLLISQGEVQLARVAANMTATTADFTAGRKTLLLSLIDAAISKL